MNKRLFDLIFSGLGLFFLSPFFIFIALWIKWDSPGPIFFRQERVGQFGKIFYIHKFRTMIVDAEKYGAQITIGKDSRITKTGFILRQYKLDELPQLIDVFLGKMSLVGPRPEVPKYVNYYPEDVRDIILSVKPGITDQASIEFRNENALLSQALDPEKTYKENILPIKLEYYKNYALKNNIYDDYLIIIKTLKALF
ncbi:MAG: sugar transferase [Thiothrix sp.]|nr:MAG: sugar transferase [Thiothrix sp.]